MLTGQRPGPQSPALFFACRPICGCRRAKNATMPLSGRAMQYPMRSNGFAMSRPIMPGKCVIIACALTIIERMALPERPAFFIVAGQRGGGKTTTLHMISSRRCWDKGGSSGMVAERRGTPQGAVRLSQRPGLPFLVWDNIPLGAAIGCPAIERALTTEVYSDRVLGVSEYREVSGVYGAWHSPETTSRRAAICRPATLDREDYCRSARPGEPKIHACRPGRAGPSRTARTSCRRFTRSYSATHAFMNLKANKPAETRFKAWWHLCRRRHRARGLHAAAIQGKSRSRTCFSTVSETTSNHRLLARF